MSAGRALLSRFLATFRRRDADLDEEIRAHLDLLTDEHLRQGMGLGEARRAARRAFGGVSQTAEVYREQRRLPLVDAIGQDLHYALRQLRHHPAFTAAALLTLSFGIGATSAIFGVVDAVILKPLPYRDADRLVVVHEWTPGGATPFPVNSLHFTEWRRASTSFESLALIGSMGDAAVNLTVGGRAEHVVAARASAALFPMLGIRAQLGRLFRDDEETAGRNQVVLVTDRLWRTRFGSDPQIVGRRIELNGLSHEVVGVLPPSFRFARLGQLYPLDVAADRPDLWTPFTFRENEMILMGAFNSVCVGRLKPGRSIAQATAEIDAIQADISRRVSGGFDLRSRILPLQDQVVSRSRASLVLTFAAVVTVLLIACVNVTNLVLARISARRRELAVRAALGASSGRLVRQMVVESLVMSGLGGLGGAAIAFFAVRLILAAAPADVPRLDEVRLDLRFIAFTLAVVTVTGLLVSALPALRFGRARPCDAVGSGARATSDAGGSCARSLLVSAEVSLSAVCLIVAGLLLQSFVRVLGVDRGFETDRLVTADVNLLSRAYETPEARVRFIDTALERLRVEPGVAAAAVVNRLPLAGEGSNGALLVEGTAADIPLLERPLADFRTTDPGYFGAMQIALVAGRFFDDRDRQRPVAVISRSTAEQAWPGVNPIGRRFKVGRPERPWVEVIGIAGDVRGSSLDRPPSPVVYLPYWQMTPGGLSFIAKAAGDPAPVGAAVRTSLGALDPELPLGELRTMDELVAASVSQRRFQLQLVLLFGAAALLLAALGIYGVVSYAVVQRTPEIGVRIALGAGRAAVSRMVLSQALRLVGLGLVVGVPAALATGALLRTLLFEVVPYDAATLAGVCVLLTTVALVSAYLPSRRASRVDPMSALRCE